MDNKYAFIQIGFYGWVTMDNKHTFIWMGYYGQ